MTPATVPAVLLFFEPDGTLTRYDTRTLAVMCSDVAQAVALLRERRPTMVLRDDAKAVEMALGEAQP